MVLHARVLAGMGGGPEKTIRQSFRHVDPQQWQMAAVYIHPPGDEGFASIQRQALAENMPLWDVEEVGPIDPRTVRHLVSLCRKQRVAIWHAHDHKSNFLGLVLRRFWPMKLVTTVHGWTSDTARMCFYEKIDRWCIKRYDQVIAVSPKLVDDCRSCGVDESRLSYIPNGIEAEDYHRRFTPTMAKQQLDIAAEPLAIGMVGRLSKEKGVDRAIRTIAQLHQQHRPVQLHLIGDGPERANLQGLADELGLHEVVRFWGWQTNPARWYEMMDLLLLTSHTEGLPNVVFEAMAMGVPVAATGVGGVREQLDGGRCGLILDQDAPDSWAGQIATLLTHHSQRAAMAQRAKQRVEREYSFADRMAKIFSVYRQVMGQPVPTVAEPSRRAA